MKFESYRIPGIPRSAGQDAEKGGQVGSIRLQLLQGEEERGRQPGAGN